MLIIFRNLHGLEATEEVFRFLVGLYFGSTY